MTTDESPSVGEPGVTVLLHDGQSGAIIGTPQMTAGPTGAYSFTGLTPLTMYYVTAAVERKQMALPAEIPRCPGSLPADFKIRGIPAPVTLTGARPGTFILLSQGAYNQPNSPAVTANGPTPYFSSVAGPNGTAMVEVPASTTPYYFTCWMPPSAGSASVAYTRVPNGTGSTLIGVMTPGNPQTVHADICH